METMQWELESLLMRNVDNQVDVDAFGTAPNLADLLANDPFSTLVLVPYLPSKTEVDDVGNPVIDLFRTFDTLAKMIFSQHKPEKGYSNYRSDYLEDPKKMRLLQGITPPKPGFRWELITFETNPGKKPKDVQNPTTSPHIGVLAAAFFNPDWVKRMNGEDGSRYHWIPGINVFDGSQWSCVPHLHFGRSGCRVGLGTGDCGGAFSDWAFPALRECI
jgi:hypothetical protein